MQVASCSTHTAAEGNDCSLTTFRVDTCAHSVYRQQLSWYEGRDLPSSRRLWCNGRQTSQYRRSGNVEEGREGTRQTLDLVTPIAFFASTCRVATSFTTTSAIKSLEPLTIDCMFAKAFIHLQRASLAFVIHCHFSSNFNYTYILTVFFSCRFLKSCYVCIMCELVSARWSRYGKVKEENEFWNINHWKAAAFSHAFHSALQAQRRPSFLIKTWSTDGHDKHVTSNTLLYVYLIEYTSKNIFGLQAQECWMAGWMNGPFYQEALQDTS